MSMLAALVALVLAQPLAATPAPSPKAVELARFGRLPSIEMVRLSPDGALLAMVVGDETGRQIQIRDRATKKSLHVINAHGVKVRDLRWAGPNHLLVTTSKTTAVMGLIADRREYVQVLDLDISKDKTQTLLDKNGDLPNTPLNAVFGAPTIRIINGSPFAFVKGESFPSDQGVYTPYSVDLDNQRTRDVRVGDEDTDSWLVDAAGRPIVETAYNSATGLWRLRARGAAGWKEIKRVTALLDLPTVEALTPDGTGVVVAFFEGGLYVDHAVTLTTGVTSGPIDDYSRGDLITDPRTDAPIGRAVTGSMAAGYVFFSPTDRNAWASASNAFPNETVRLESWSDDRREIVVSAEGERDGASFFVVDLNKKTADWLGDEYDGLGPEEASPRRAITYDAADGTKIQAYLTLPRGRPEQALPLVVLPHGGPAARDEPGFDWWSQALASRGYAVLQPQFRGSDGFGYDFLAAGYGQWGRKMQTDLSDGVRALAKQGKVDAARVCIVGASYGGYAALAGAALDPGVYRCAASLAGPADLPRMLTWEADRARGSRNETQRYWDRFMGAARASDPSLVAISPARHADAVTIPVLLIHGLDDTVADYEQSRLMKSALERAGKRVEMVTLKGEDHWLSKSETRLQMLAAMVAFLERENPAG